MTARDVPGVIAPPPLIYLGFLFAAWGLGRLIETPGFGLDGDIRRGLAVVLVIGGLTLEAMALGLFRRLGTPPQPWKPTTALATGGVYRFSRNPIYLGFTLIYAGFAVAMDNPVALAGLFPCLIVIDRFVVAREERYLDVKFGQEWRAYRVRVRRWL